MDDYDDFMDDFGDSLGMDGTPLDATPDDHSGDFNINPPK